MTSSLQNTDALKSLSEKRHALESLIKITASIQEQQKSLLELSAVSDIKQDFTEKMTSHIKLLKEKVGNLPLPNLLKKLDKIEQVTERNLEQIIRLVEVDPDDLRDGSIHDFSVDEFIDRISNFKRHTQTSIGLRLILKDRNVAIAPFRLPIPQAELNQHILTLKRKEQQCIKIVKKDIVEVIKDSTRILQDESLSQQMKDCITSIKKEMEENLKHLDNGGKIDKLPATITHHVLETKIEEQAEINAAVNLRNEDNKPKVEEQTANKNQVEEISDVETTPLSGWQIFKMWLASPMSVSWSELKQTPTKTPKK